MNKKAIAILGGIFILIVGTLGVIIYLRSRTPAPEPVTEEQATEEVVTEELLEEELPVEESSAQNATRIIDEGVITPVLFFQGDGIAYFNTQGQLFRTQMSISDGTVLLSNKTQLTVPARSGISKILWPQVGNSYITESGLGSAKQWAYYNPDSGQYVDLPQQVKSLAWMPNGNKIMYTWLGTDGKATLNIADPDAKNYQTLTGLYDPDYTIHVSPDGQKVLFYRNQTNDLTKNQITQVTSDGKTFTAIIRDGYNKGVLWSPDSQKFLFTKRDSFTSQFALWYANLATGETKNLGLATSETKAVWQKDSQTVVVAAPPSAGSAETIFIVDTATNTKNEVNPGTSITAEELFLSLDESVLFFRNNMDNGLYYLFLNSTIEEGI